MAQIYFGDPRYMRREFIQMPPVKPSTPTDYATKFWETLASCCKEVPNDEDGVVLWFGKPLLAHISFGQLNRHHVLTVSDVRSRTWQIEMEGTLGFARSSGKYIDGNTLVLELKICTLNLGVRDAHPRQFSYLDLSAI